LLLIWHLIWVSFLSKVISHTHYIKRLVSVLDCQFWNWCLSFLAFRWNERSILRILSWVISHRWIWPNLCLWAWLINLLEELRLRLSAFFDSTWHSPSFLYWGFIIWVEIWWIWSLQLVLCLRKQYFILAFWAVWSLILNFLIYMASVWGKLRFVHKSTVMIVLQLISDCLINENISFSFWDWLWNSLHLKNNIQQFLYSVVFFRNLLCLDLNIFSKA